MDDEQPYQTVAPPVWWVEGETIILGAKGCRKQLRIIMGEDDIEDVRKMLLEAYDFKKGRP